MVICLQLNQGGATKLRFQPNNGRMLAAAVGNVVSIIDIETQVCRVKLQVCRCKVHSFEFPHRLVNQILGDVR